MILDYITPTGLVIKGQPIDTAKVADAFRAKPQASERTGRQLEPAFTREPCLRCGIPGSKGCNHQLPFVPVEVEPLWNGAKAGTGFYRYLKR